MGRLNFEHRVECDDLEDYNDECSLPYQVPIEKIIKHSEFVYDSASNDSQLNDIALVKLEYHVEYSDVVKPICLPMENYELTNSTEFTLTGFGT